MLWWLYEFEDISTRKSYLWMNRWNWRLLKDTEATNYEIKEILKLKEPPPVVWTFKRVKNRSKERNRQGLAIVKDWTSSRLMKECFSFQPKRYQSCEIKLSQVAKWFQKKKYLKYLMCKFSTTDNNEWNKKKN